MSGVTRSLALLTALVVAPLALHADSYNFTIRTSPANTDPAYNFVASGTISGAIDPFNSAAIDVSSITGSANGYDFLGVVDPGATNSHTPATFDTFTFNNVLNASDPHADALGFLLYLNSPIGVSLAHVFSTGKSAANPGGYEVDVVDPNDPGAFTPFAIDSFTITSTPSSAVPEPSTLALCGTGVLALYGAARRKLNR